jgi:hypothetical protein
MYLKSSSTGSMEMEKAHPCFMSLWFPCWTHLSTVWGTKMSKWPCKKPWAGEGFDQKLSVPVVRMQTGTLCLISVFWGSFLISFLSFQEQRIWHLCYCKILLVVFLYCPTFCKISQVSILSY